MYKGSRIIEGYDTLCLSAGNLRERERLKTKGLMLSLRELPKKKKKTKTKHFLFSFMNTVYKKYCPKYMHNYAEKRKKSNKLPLPSSINSYFGTHLELTFNFRMRSPTHIMREKFLRFLILEMCAQNVMISQIIPLNISMSLVSQVCMP